MIRVLFVSLFSFLLLTGCSSAQATSQDLNSLGSSLSTVDTIEFSGEANSSEWSAVEPFDDVLFRFSGKADISSGVNQKFSLSGTVFSRRNGERLITSGKLLGLNEGAFFKMDEIQVPSSGLPALATPGHWFQLTGERNLSSRFLGVDQITLNDRQFSNLKQILAEIDFLTQEEVLGKELIFGHLTRHLRVGIEPSEFRSWVADLERIIEVDVDQESIIEFFQENQIEVWQDTRNDLPRRIRIINESFGLTVNIDSFNEELDFESPPSNRKAIDSEEHFLPSADFGLTN